MSIVAKEHKGSLGKCSSWKSKEITWVSYNKLKDYRWPARGTEEIWILFMRLLQEISRNLKWTNVENNGSVFISLLFICLFVFCTVNTGMDWQVIKTLQTAHCENYSKSSNQQLTLLLSKLCIHHLYFVFDI